MIATENHTILYLQAREDSFWQWADGGNVIEWENGRTICYRDDLVNLLQQCDSSLPQLSAVLLLLTGCSGELHVQERFFLIREMKTFTGNAENTEMHRKLDHADKFLKIVSELPENLRTGNKRVHLINEIFSQATYTFPNRQIQNIVREFNSGRIDEQVFGHFAAKNSDASFSRMLSHFADAYQRFPTVQNLIATLRTGLDSIPEATPVELPEKVPTGLYDELLDDPKTVGIARLAKRLIAALNIPMQSKGSSDLPLGGISDITNRGNYDKLLLTELAHDDDTLMARLVNNEALYFRREQPPENPKMQRVILMDTTIKMWGTSRVFALSAGLACATQNKRYESLLSYSLGGNTFTPVSLNSKHGIIQALELLDPALHCGAALEEVMRSVSGSVKNEFIFITHARLLNSASFHAYYATVKPQLSFVITVTDVGDLHLYECINGVSKLISNAKIDVDELLTAPHQIRKRVKQTDPDLPAFLQQTEAPLYFPVNRVRF